MDNCNLAIIDLTNSRNMTVACFCIVLGILLREMYKPGQWVFLIASLSLYVTGFLLLGYILDQNMPDKRNVFWPAIFVIIISSILYFAFSDNTIVTIGCLLFYTASWLVLGNSISSHLDGMKKYLGLAIGVVIAVSTPFIMGPFGAAGYTAALGVLCLVQGLPTYATLINDFPDCVQSILNQVPQLSPYTKEIECIIKTPCFNKLKTMSGTSADKLKIIAQAIQCAVTQCPTPILTSISSNFDCFAAQGCFDAIVNNPPMTSQDWVTALTAVFGCMFANSSKCLSPINK